MASHSWEAAPARDHAREDVEESHEWETAAAPDEDDDDEWQSVASSDDEPLTEEGAGEQFVAMLTDMLLQSGISAKTFCLLCFWAARADAKGPAKTYGKAPGARTGHYQRHLDGLLGFQNFDQALLNVQVPAKHKHDMGRCEHTLPLLPPHEALYKEVSDNPSILTDLEQADPAEYGTGYTAHPAVLTPGPPVLPLALYLDGVPYTSRQESVVGVWCYSLLTQKRHLCALLRKRNMCNCGCKSWCTWYVVYRMLAWSVGALREGFFPNRRPDGDWQLPADATRAERAGQPLTFRAVICRVKGDWMEFTTAFGLPPWNSGMRPCPFCNCDQENMFEVEQMNARQWPFHLNTAEDYFRACQRCEVVVAASEQDRDTLLHLLFYDKRDQGGRGRCLRHPYPKLGLDAGDRLEPSDALWDVGQLESLTAFPVRLTFWRGSRETLAKHRCPIFGPETQISPTELVVDPLHTLHLGVMQWVGKEIVWRRMDANAWEVLGPESVVIDVSISLLRTELLSWYKEQRKLRPGDPLTEISDLTPKMLGSRPRKRLKLKAAETWGFVRFLPTLLAKYGSYLGTTRAPFTQAVNAIIRHVDAMRQHPAVLPPHVVQDVRWRYPPG